MSGLLSCGDTYQIWMWLKNLRGTFIYKIENIRKGEFNKQNSSDPCHGCCGQSQPFCCWFCSSLHRQVISKYICHWLCGINSSLFSTWKGDGVYLLKKIQTNINTNVQNRTGITQEPQNSNRSIYVYRDVCVHYCTDKIDKLMDTVISCLTKVKINNQNPSYTCVCRCQYILHTRTHARTHTFIQ